MCSAPASWAEGRRQEKAYAPSLLTTVLQDGEDRDVLAKHLEEEEEEGEGAEGGGSDSDKQLVSTISLDTLHKT